MACEGIAVPRGGPGPVRGCFSGSLAVDARQHRSRSAAGAVCGGGSPRWQSPRRAPGPCVPRGIGSRVGKLLSRRSGLVRPVSPAPSRPPVAGKSPAAGERPTDWEGVLPIIAIHSRQCRPLLRHVSRRGRAAADAADAAEPRRRARLRAADFCSSVQALDWAWGQGMPRDRRVSAAAAGRGALEALRWAVRNECPLDWRSAASAARGGHLDVLMWMARRRGSWRGGEGSVLPDPHAEAKVCAAAAHGGCLPVLQWLRIDQGLHWGARTISEAASKGHLHVVRWARRQGCPWDVHATSSAAWGGHLPVLAWLRAHGCPWDRRTTAAAVMAGQPQVLCWLGEHSCPGADEEARCPQGSSRRQWCQRVQSL